jgi:hypothetical protein
MAMVAFLVFGTPAPTQAAKKDAAAVATKDAAVLVPAAVVAKDAASQPAAAVASVAPVHPAAPTAVVIDAEAKVAQWWQLLLRHLMEIIFSILGIMATGFVAVLLKKYGFEAQTAKINDVLERAVSYAEQKAISATKLNGQPSPGAAKMEMALDFARMLAREYKIQEKGKEWWTGRLEGWLGASKIKA